MISTIEGFKYKEYRHKRFERLIVASTYVVEWMSVVLSTILLKVLAGWLVALIFPFMYDLVHRMKNHSIYFYDDKGLGPTMLETFAEDAAHASRYMAFCVLIAWAISPATKFINISSENAAMKEKHESNTERGNKHDVRETESSSVSVDGRN